MDRLPLVPPNEDHDVLPLLTEIFQDAFRKNKYPKNVAENYTKYRVDTEYSDLQANAWDTIKIIESEETHLGDIAKTEEELMKNHAMAIIEKRNNPELSLKKPSLFQKLSEYAVRSYDLIQTTDLYPNRIEQSLDFTLNPSLPCSTKVVEKPGITSKLKPVITSKLKHHKRTRTRTERVSSPFVAEPDRILFYNYELSRVYKQKLKVRNVTKQPQNFNYYDLPKQSPFRLKMVTDSCRLAPGMSAEFLVTFKLESYQTCEQLIRFRTVKGVDFGVRVGCDREPPILLCYVVNPLLPWDLVDKPSPGNCGTCLLGNYSLVTVVMKNNGQKGRFFITTENEWCFSELRDESTTRTYELHQGCFTVFPTFFQIDGGEVGEIFVLFTPEKLGMFTEKLYVICDNNSHLEIEILGDCVMFTTHILNVNMYLMEKTFVYTPQTLSITMMPGETSGLIFSFINNSPLHFAYYWALKTLTAANENKKMDPNWISILFDTHYLPSFSDTDVVVQLTPDAQKEGTYYLYLSLYLKDLPVDCIAPDVKFTRKDCGSKLVDVHILELGIFCTVEIPRPLSICTVSNMEEPPETPPSLRLSKIVLQFGVLPIGVTVSKCFTVANLTDEEVDWRLMEIYATDGTNLYISTEMKSLSCHRGVLKGGKSQRIVYTVEAKNSVRWFSLLCLLSCPTCSCQNHTMEDLCLVTYEVPEIDITIRADNNLPLLCPRDFIYLGVPIIDTFNIHNAGILPGCFYFLKPTGADSRKLSVRFQPQSGIIPSGATTKVQIELLGLESGILENIYIPCFVGDPEHLISLTVFCTVATINVYFHLPSQKGGFVRLLWPPKKDTPSWDFQIRGEDGVSLVGEGGFSTPTTTSGLSTLIGPDSVANTYQTIATKVIRVRKPAKLTFYIENVTPTRGYFTVQATNYEPGSDCLEHILVKAEARTPEFFWDKACLAGYGIVVEPVHRSGDVVPYEVVQVDLWIYANTYGKYLEEMIVEINDLTPFCFNLVIEIEGVPIEFPFARNTTLQCPTIRFNSSGSFENIAYCAENVTKTFTVANISAVPLELNWHAFTPAQANSAPPFNFLVEFHEDDLNLVLTRDFYGCQACPQCILISPSSFVLEKQSTTTVTISVSARGFLPKNDKTCLKYILVCFIGLRNSDKFKENYFKRESGVEVEPAKIEVLVTLEMPSIKVDVSSDETVINIFVNDVLVEKRPLPEVYLLLRNVDKSSVIFGIDIEKPFEIIEARTVPTGLRDRQNFVLHKNECLQVMVGCQLTHADFLDYAKLVYTCDNPGCLDETESYTSVISKTLNIRQKGAPLQKIPFQVRLHYPHIVVKPNFIKFGQCLLYNTKKAIFTIYNMTGSVAKFEIFKTTKLDNIEVRPNNGEITKNTGINKQFIDVAVYFTPKHCEPYMECLRIFTNIPNYYLDLPVTGYGSNNEKFHVD